MHTLAKIQHDAKAQHWSYPKTFEALKAAGVNAYTVELADQYQTTFTGTFGEWAQTGLEGYRPLKIAEQFSAKDISQAIDKHMQGKTSYLDFLEAIAKAGVSHYRVNMSTRQIRYFDPNETHYHQEIVPAGE